MLDMERRFREEFELEPQAVLISLRGGDSDEAFEAPPFNRRAALEEIEELSGKIGGLGSVNIGAVAQYDAVKERLDFLTEQKTDLETSRDELNDIIAEIDGRMRTQFMTTFDALVIAFAETFEKAFGGGKTHLALTDPANLLETGIELRVQMPGKAAQDISLLSGGERALTALSFLLAILKVRPAPFVILDEVDAPLDQSNVSRFTDLLRDFTASTQFIVITHNNGTMQAADVLYGVTQQELGVSTLMSVRLAEEEELEGNRRGRETAAV
jgi:chromosome segregation protein